MKTKGTKPKHKKQSLRAFLAEHYPHVLHEYEVINEHKL